MTDVCLACFNRAQAAERSDGLCDECGDWQDYWSSLSPGERRRELDMMAAYAAEAREG